MIMFERGMYGVVLLPNNKFNLIDEPLLITGCTNNVKLMCANEKETKYLENIGVDINGVICDWYRIEKL